MLKSGRILNCDVLTKVSMNARKNERQIHRETDRDRHTDMYILATLSASIVVCSAGSTRATWARKSANDGHGTPYIGRV